MYFSNGSFVIFVVVFIGFFVLAGCMLKYLHERRLRARLQAELGGLLFDYVPMDGHEIETISFIHAHSNSTSDMQKV